MTTYFVEKNVVVYKRYWLEMIAVTVSKLLLKFVCVCAGMWI